MQRPFAAPAGMRPFCSPPVDSQRRQAHTLSAPTAPPTLAHTSTMLCAHSAPSWRPPHLAELCCSARRHSRSALAPLAGALHAGQLSTHRRGPEVPQRVRSGHRVRRGGVPCAARAPACPTPVFSGQMVQRWPRTGRSSDPLHLATSFLRSSARRGEITHGELESSVGIDLRAVSHCSLAAAAMCCCCSLTGAGWLPRARQRRHGSVRRRCLPLPLASIDAFSLVFINTTSFHKENHVEIHVPCDTVSRPSRLRMLHQTPLSYSDVQSCAWRNYALAMLWSVFCAVHRVSSCVLRSACSGPASALVRISASCFVVGIQWRRTRPLFTSS